MLSRKYYKAFADMLKQSETKEELKALMIRFFINDNPRFNITTFDKASRKD